MLALQGGSRAGSAGRQKGQAGQAAGSVKYACEEVLVWGGSGLEAGGRVGLWKAWVRNEGLERCQDNEGDVPAPSGPCG